MKSAIPIVALATVLAFGCTETRPPGSAVGSDGGTGVCPRPAEGCGCENGAIAECYLAPTVTEDGLMCGRGERVCQDGVWGMCALVEMFPPMMSASALITAPTVCGVCDPDCFTATDYPVALDVTAANSLDVVYDDAPGTNNDGVYLIGTPPASTDTDGDGVIDLADDCDDTMPPATGWRNVVGDMCDGTIDDGVYTALYWGGPSDRPQIDTIVPAVPVVSPCTNMTIAGRDYAFCDTQTTWPLASAACASYGMTLATIDDAAENTALFDAAQAIDSSSGWWMGLTDVPADGAYDDWDDGGGSLYRSWVSGHPSGAGRCATLRVTQALYEWHTHDCGDSRRFVCEEGSGLFDILGTVVGDTQGFVTDVRAQAAMPTCAASAGATFTDCAAGTNVRYRLEFTPLAIAPAMDTVYDFTFEVTANGTLINSVPIRVLWASSTVTYAPGSYWRDYDATSVCTIPDERPDWQDLVFDVDTPGDSTIDFELRTADTLAGLASATAVTLTSPPTSSPIDVGASLLAGGQLNMRPFLRVTAALNPSTSLAQTPQFISMEQTFRCVDAE